MELTVLWFVVINISFLVSLAISIMIIYDVEIIGRFKKQKRNAQEINRRLDVDDVVHKMIVENNLSYEDAIELRARLYRYANIK